MAYQMKRRKPVVETLELVNEYGAVEKTIELSLDPDAMVKKVSRKYVELLTIQQKAAQWQKSDDAELAGVVEEVGAAFVDLMEAVFGEEDAHVILDFYENRVQEMVQEVMPFIAERVIPRLRESAQANRKERARKYGLKG